MQPAVLRKIIVKLAISAAMLAVVYCLVDLERLRTAMQAVSLRLIMFASVGYIATQLISAVRWWLLLRAAGNGASYSKTVRAFFVGMYLNCFGLGTVGGDLARGVLVTDGRHHASSSFGSVVADRTLGLATLAGIGLGSALVFRFPLLRGGLFYVAMALVVLIPAAWRLGPRLLRSLAQSSSNIGKITKGFLGGFPTDTRVVAPVVLVAITFHLLQICLFGAIVSMLGASIPVAYLLAYIPFANIISTLPLSWMGLGVRENVYVLFFVPAFLTSEQAIVAAAIWLLAMTAASAAGGIIAVVTGDLKLLREFSGRSER